MNAITISTYGNAQHSVIIAAFNELIKNSVKKYENGDKLENKVEALALYNIVLLCPRVNDDDFESDKWDAFTLFAQGDVPTFQLSRVEEGVISSSMTGKYSYAQLASIEAELSLANSNKTSQITKVIENLYRMTNSGVKEEDVLITSFIEPLLMEPFLREIQNTTIHGNGRALYESYIRKVRVAGKYGLSKGGIKGRSPDRTIVVNLSSKKYSVFVVEVKTTESSRQKPDIVKLASLMKDMLDFAITEGASNHFTMGMLIEGPSCKVFKMTMPIQRMYCLHEISSFFVPTNLHDENLQSKLEQLILSMLQCQQLVNNSIDNLIDQQSSHARSPYEIIDSYTSPPQHYAYYEIIDTIYIAFSMPLIINMMKNITMDIICKI